MDVKLASFIDLCHTTVQLNCMFTSIKRLDVYTHKRICTEIFRKGAEHSFIHSFRALLTLLASMSITALLRNVTNSLTWPFKHKTQDKITPQESCATSQNITSYETTLRSCVVARRCAKFPTCQARLRWVAPLTRRSRRFDIHGAKWINVATVTATPSDSSQGASSPPPVATLAWVGVGGFF